MENLIPIPSFELAPGAALPFSLFVRLPVTDRVILYRREGSTMDQEKLERVSQKQLKFFVQKHDYEKYLEYASRQLLELIRLQPRDTGKLRAAANQMLTSAFAQDDLKNAREIVSNMGDLVTQVVSEISSDGFMSRQSLFLRFAKLAQTGTDFQRHPLHVASLAVMMAMGLGVTDQLSLVEIGLAGLLHDLGLTSLPMSVIEESHRYKDLGTVSRALLKLHPQGTIDLLRQRGVGISQLMETMILQHHEEYNGTGYPAGLAGNNVHMLAQVLHVADDLDDLLVTASSTPELDAQVRILFNRYETDHVISPQILAGLRTLLL